MHDQATVSAVLALVENGLNDCAVARRTGVPRSTVRDWRIGQTPSPERQLCDLCRGCEPTLPESQYAYLLGLYLGDGCITEYPRTFRFRLFLDAKYSGIVREAAGALRVLRPANVVWAGPHGRGTIQVSMSWNHWPCLFPQHGPGKKHDRPIYLAEWQAALVGRQRKATIRGLLQSDGCRVIANDRGVASVRYHFANLSEDIKRIYCDCLDALGVPWTRPSDKDIAVYRKAATAYLTHSLAQSGRERKLERLVVARVPQRT